MHPGSSRQNDIVVPKEDLFSCHEAEGYHRAVVEQAREMIFLVDVGTKCLMEINPAFQKILGYTAEEAKRLGLYDLIAHDKDSVDLNIRHIQKEKHYFIGERRYRRKDGSLVDVEVDINFIEYGGKEALCVIARDITERKIGEEHRSSLLRFQNELLDNAAIWIDMFDAHGNITFWNIAAERISGYSRDEVLGQAGIWKLLYPDPEYRAKMIDQVREILLRKERVDELETVVRRKDGKQRVISWHSNNFLDDSGKIMGGIGIGVDVTDHKQAEETYRVLVDNSLQGLIIFQNSRVVFANEAYARMVGYTLEEMLAMSFEEIQAAVHPDDRAMVWGRFRDRLNGKDVPDNYKFRIIRKDGLTVWAEMHASLTKYQGKPAVQVAIIDITQRRLAEEALKESEAKYRRLFENSPVGIISMDLDGNITEANECLVKVMGSPSIQATKQINALEFTPLIEAGFSDCFRRCIESGEPIFYEHSYLSKWNKPIHLRLRLIPIHDAKGLITGAQGTVEDISDQKHAAKALKESETRYRTLAESAQDSIYRIGPDMRVMYVNSFAARLLGAEQEDIVGKSLDSLFPSETMETMAPRLRSVFQTGKPSLVESKIVFYQGVMWQNTSLAPIKDPSGKVTSVLGVSRDITDRKLAEGKLMASLREKEVLLMEIHHRVKNNLQIISSLLNIQSRYVEDEGTKNALAECQGRVKSMALIHESLYRSEDFARVDFARYIQNLTEALFHSYNVDKKIIRYHLDLEEVFLEIDQAIPCGLILNELVTNCLKHAFPDGRCGEIKIELRSCNDLISLIVKDNGIGMSARSISSKDSRSLGLKLVDSLVKQLKGTIETDLSIGTEFRITFPMS